MRTTLLAAALVGAVLSTSCGTVQSVGDSADILSFEKEWTGLYQQLPTDPASVRPKLTSLSERAEAQGDAAASRNDLAKAVSFYRIAATSAWQAGPPRDTAVLTLQQKGSAACAKLPQRDASQPRDCALIKMTPSLATLDAKARKVEELRDAEPTILAGRLNEAESVVRDVTSLTQVLLDARSLAGALSDSFDDYMKLNFTREYCIVEGFTGHFGWSNPPADQHQRVNDMGIAMRHSLESARVSTSCP
jgi:hypothetical protein